MFDRRQASRLAAILLTTMKHLKPLVLPALVLAALGAWLWPMFRPAQADMALPIPPVIQAGLSVYASGGADPALAVWRRAGPLEEDKKAIAEGEDFKEMVRAFGHYRSYELIEAKEVCRTSRVFYLAVNYERGAAFLSFVAFKASKDWVVQNLEFNVRPDVIMPWLTSGSSDSP